MTCPPTLGVRSSPPSEPHSVSTRTNAEAIVRASEPLWNAMEEAGGLVDSWGGGEFCHLFPKMCSAIKPTR